MRTALTRALSLFILGITASALSSCSPVEQVDALVTEEGEIAGVVVQYNSSIDKTSVNSDTYQVAGGKISTLFVSDSNPFRKDKRVKMEGGRYVVILLKAKDNKSAQNEPVELVTGDKRIKIDVKVKQVAPVTTSSGKVIKPWGKPVKATEAYRVEGGVRK